MIEEKSAQPGSYTEDKKPPANIDIQALAEEIYKLLKKDLELEKERTGRK